jgi:uncharacterized membrane protein
VTLTRLKTKRKPSDEATSSVPRDTSNIRRPGGRGHAEATSFISMLAIFWLMVSKPTLW